MTSEPSVEEVLAGAQAAAKLSCPDDEWDDLPGEMQGVFVAEANAVLRAAAAVREKTHVVVPREATDEMCAAGRQALRKGGLMPAYTDTGSAGQMPVLQFLLRDAWAAMLAASGDNDGR